MMWPQKDAIQMLCWIEKIISETLLPILYLLPIITEWNYWWYNLFYKSWYHVNF